MGGAINILDTTEFSINNVLFENLVSFGGGAIHMEAKDESV